MGVSLGAHTEISAPSLWLGLILNTRDMRELRNQMSISVCISLAEPIRSLLTKGARETFVSAAWAFPEPVSK